MFLTDVNDDEVLSNLQRNCVLNDVTNCEIVPLRWGSLLQPSVLSVVETALIVAADCLFDKSGMTRR